MKGYSSIVLCDNLIEVGRVELLGDEIEMLVEVEAVESNEHER